LRPGFNIVGHLHASAGLGIAARDYAAALVANGYDVVGLNVDYGSGGKRNESLAAMELVDSAEALPFRHSLIFLAVQLLPTHWLRRMPALRHPRLRNAGVLFWELPVFPKAFAPAIQLFDAVVTPSHFVRQAVEMTDPSLPTFFAEYPLALPASLESTALVRARLAIPPDAFVFAASFDLAGDVSRKNPAAIVSAFRTAFADDPQTWLILKCNGDVAKIPDHPDLRAARASIANATNIRLVVETIGYADVLALYSASDAYISLHRAEGLGLGAMEAMALGKAVIATGYSGNMTYMNEQNSELLPYRLIPTHGSAWQYSRAFVGPGAIWADVDIRLAAQAMVRVRTDAEFRDRIAHRAKRDIAERQATAWASSYVPQLIETLDRGERVGLRDKFASRLRRSEITNLVQLRLNVKSFLTRGRG